MIKRQQFKDILLGLFQMKCLALNILFDSEQLYQAGHEVAVAQADHGAGPPAPKITAMVLSCSASAP